MNNDLFVGFATLSENLDGVLFTANDSLQVADAADFPTFRIYGAAGFVISGVTTFEDSGTVTDATNASPIVITSAAHGLTNGARITVASVGGNTAANGTFIVANASTDTFELSGSTGNGAYTSGGSWHVVGLYAYEVDISEANGFASGESYFICFNFVVGSTNKGLIHSFLVD